ncbi:MAG: hypothetical protein CSYNP_03744 [Syntrophus sp. SKADARSKE-3]|nr:hypothetical protein [Syntrophus sp. SKADARSKE-3]
MAGYVAAINYLDDIRRGEEVKRMAKEQGLAKFAELPEARKREAEARYEILAGAYDFIEAGRFRKDEGIRLFSLQYNAGNIELPDWVNDALKGMRKLDRSTLYRWEKRYNEKGLFGLAGTYGCHRDGVTQLTDSQKDFVKAMIANHPDVLIPKIMAGLNARFIPQGLTIPASPVVSRFVRKYRKDNASLLLAMKNPDEWRSRHQFAVGSCSENILRLNQLWEADATPADIMLTEGRHTAIAVIDVWSRRPKLFIIPTSKAQAIATLIRRCLLDWGVPEVLRTDNGKDFTAGHMKRVLDALEIEQDLCPPFTPEAKPHVERFIQTFSYGIVELLPGYIGHNVAERKAIENRKSFAARLMKKGEIIDVKLSAIEFQEICDRWINAIYMNDPHSGLDGMTPALKVRSWTEPVRNIADVRALDILLAPAPKDGGWRTIVKKGVEVNRRHYFSMEMAGYEGKRVQALLDHTDLGRIYCFLESGEFLCTGLCPDWYGISAQDEAAHIKHKQKQIVAEYRKELKLLAKEHRIETLPEEILAYRESLMENIRELPKETTEHTTPALMEAALAVADRDGEKNRAALAGTLDLPPEVIAFEEEQKKVVSIQEKRRERKLFADNEEIYFWIFDQIKAGKATSAHRLWKKEYEDWQDRSLRGKKSIFQSTISIEELLGQGDEDKSFGGK